jgi:hypothetical protein
MAFDWGKCLTLAEFLPLRQPQANSGFGEEAAFRCATSRAYYEVRRAIVRTISEQRRHEIKGQ